MVCDNYMMREFLGVAPSPLKRMVQYQTADHKLLSDGEYYQLVLNDFIKFADDVKEAKLEKTD